MFLQHLDGAQWWVIVLIIAEFVGFVLYTIVVVYLFVFAFSSTFKRSVKYKHAKKQYRYVVFFPIYNQNEIIINSINSFFKQEYPDTQYDIVIISNNDLAQINAKLAELPVKLMLYEGSKYSKIEAIQFAMSNLPLKSYDAAVIMDADNTTDPLFLSQINDAYYSGCKAIQTHRVAKSITSDTALFEAVSQEINNSIFRMGHVNLGLSSALIGSGMIVNFDWLKKNITASSNTDLEKQLETMLLEQSIFIEYLSEVYVYGETVNETEEFYQERQRWFAARVESVKLMLSKLPAALTRGNYDYCDKLFQWIMPSRTIIFGTLFIIVVIIMVIAWTVALKWLGLFFMLIIAFSLAMPDI